MHPSAVRVPSEVVRPGPLIGRERAFFLAGLIVFALLHFVYSHNSGYGYDALEYLVIGRSMNEGMRFFDLVPSKSWAMYGFTSTLMAMGVPLQHKSLSVLLAVLATSVVGAVYLVTRRIAGPTAAAIGASLAGLCAMFMEMNFYEPMTFVTLGGLGAFAVLMDERRRLSTTWLLLAGLALAFGFHFKSVAAFYGAAIVVWSIIEWRRGRLGGREVVRMLGWIFVGGAAGIAVPVAYFAATGRLHEWWVWSFTFPLLHYPANTTWLSKLYIKLGWFHAMLLAVIVASLTPAFRRSIWRDACITLAFLMGAFSYLALFKTQSSQYCYPGAIFFVIFIASAIGRVLPNVSKRVVMLGAGVGCLLFAIALVGTYLYRPSAVARFSTLKHYPERDGRLDWMRSKFGPDGRAIFITDSTGVYFSTGITPGWVVPNTDVQTTYLYRTDPERLFAGLSDPRTRLIEFDSVEPKYEDNLLRGTPLGARFTADFQAAIHKSGFVRATDVPFGGTYWVKEAARP